MTEIKFAIEGEDAITATKEILAIEVRNGRRLLLENATKFCIHNPGQNYKIIFASDNYEYERLP